MPDVRIPIKAPNGKLDASIIPDVARFPNSVTAGTNKLPVSTSSGWDYISVSSIGGGGGGSLASTKYNPSSVVTKSVASTTIGDLDAALLAVSFTAPASGKVQIDLSATVKGSAAGTRTFWALRNGTTVVPGTTVMVHEGVNPTRATVSIIVTDLTPGQNYTFKWGAAASTGTTSLYAGGNAVDIASAGQATMVVRDAPFG